MTDLLPHTGQRNFRFAQNQGPLVHSDSDELGNSATTAREATANTIYKLTTMVVAFP